MKTIYILLAALFPSVTSAMAQSASPLLFDAPEHSFGTIREDDGPVSHIFEFTNTASHPIAIDRVSASCGCTTPDYPKAPILSGGRARITVTFDPSELPGDFSKSIAVVSGGGSYRNFLTITGSVIPRPKTLEQEFPHDMGGGLRLSTTLLAFGTVAQGRAVSMVAGYVNTSPRSVSLSFDPSDRNSEQGSVGLLTVASPPVICAGCRGNITFTYDLTATTAYGWFHNVTTPVIDGTPSSKTIYTAMTGIDSFEGVDAALSPRFFLDSSFHDFGEIRRRTVPYTFRLTATNEGAETLHIRSVAGTDGLQTTLRGGMTIAPGASLPFEVMFYTGRHSPGVVRGSIRLIVDEVTRPTREIRISAIIK